MILEAKIEKSGRWWAIEIPALEIFTQGKSKADALVMAASAIDDLAGRSLGTSARFEGERILIHSKDVAGLVAMVLKHKRSRAGLSLNDVAKRLGGKSPNTYARYERGSSMPSVEVLDRLLAAVDGRGLVLG